MGVCPCPGRCPCAVRVPLESPADVGLSTTLQALPKPGCWLHSPSPPLPSPMTLTQTALRLISSFCPRGGQRSYPGVARVSLQKHIALSEHTDLPKNAPGPRPTFFITSVYSFLQLRDVREHFYGKFIPAHPLASRVGYL